MPAPAVVVTIAGVTRTADTRRHNTAIAITDLLDQQPNTARLRVDGAKPATGAEIKIGLGGVATLAELLFAGHIREVTQIYEGDKPANIAYDVSAIDYTWLLNRRKVIKYYPSQSATAVVLDLIASFTSGFTTTNVVAGLATIDAMTFTNEDMDDALTRIARAIGGYWYVDALKDLHFFLTEATGNPTIITSASPQGAAEIFHQLDLSQIRTRVYVEGGGSNVSASAAAGDTTLLVEDRSWYSSAGGTVVVGAQRLTYTGSALVVDSVTDFAAQTGVPASWRSVVWSPALNLFVAVASTGTNRVMTSPDGISWTARSAVYNNAWWDVTWAPALGLFCAVSQDTTGGGLRVMTSPDGITWTARTHSTGSSWQAICWSPEQALFVAVAYDGTVAMTSPNGITWTNRTVPGGQWNDVCWSPELGLFCAVGGPSIAGKTNRCMTSPDGITWTARTLTDNYYVGVAWSPALGLFAAIVSADAGTNLVQTSPNGTTWTTRTCGSGTGDRLAAIVWAAELGVFITVGTTSNLAFVSSDGITWVSEAVPAGEWDGLAWAPGIQTLVAVGRAAGANQAMRKTGTAKGKLTGIPALGAGSILYPIPKGEAVNLLVARNDTTAQTALAALVGGDGIHEHYIQDNRLGQAECIARGDAELDAFKSPIETVTLTTRDPNARTGKTLQLALTAPTSINGSYKIQTVQISHVGTTSAYPLRQVTASSQRYSLEELLRIRRTA